MKEINRVLFFFLASILGAFFLVWQTIHSEYFGGILSKYSTEYIKKYIKTDIAFNRVGLELFPPGASLYDVSFNKEEGDLRLKFKSMKVSVFFNMFDAFNNELSVKELRISDSFLNISKIEIEGSESKKTSKKGRKLKFKELNKQLQNLPITVNSIGVNDLYLVEPNNSATIRRLKIGLNPKAWDGWFDIRNLRSKKLQKLQDGNLDHLKGYAVLTENSLQLKEFESYESLSKVTAQGTLENMFKENKKFSIKYQVETELREFIGYIPKEADFAGDRGYFDIKGNVEGTPDNPKGKNTIQVNNFSSNFFDADNLKISTSFKDRKLFITDFDMKRYNHRLKSRKEIYFLDLEKGKLLPSPAFLTAKQVPLTNALKYLQGELYPLKGKLNGNLAIAFTNNRIVFNTESEMQLKDFKLSVPRGKGDFTILENDELIFNKGIFIVKGTIFEILADIKFGTSNLVFKGRVGNGRVDFISEESKIKLQDFGKIAGLDIQGRGTGIVTVSGPFKDVNINLATSLKDSSFEEYFFDRSSMDVTISLAREKVILNSISGKLPNTLYFLSGDYNWSNNRINLNVNTPHSTFEDIKKMYKPLVDVLPWVPESLGGLVSNNFTVGGEVDLKKLRVKGKFKAQNLSFLTESFSDLELNFNMNKSKLDLTNLKLRKETGVLSGGYSYNINNDHYSFDFKLNNGRVSELNLAKRFFSSLRGGLSGSISGSKTKKIKIKSKLKLTDTFVLNKRMPSSKLEVDYSDNLVFYDLSYFGESATLKGKINFDEPQNSKKNLSSLKGKLDVPDLKLILVSILGEHIANTSFKGSINTTIDSKFNYNNLQELDLDATILNLKLSKDNARVENLQPGYFKITKGKIDKWKFDTQGERGLISSQGSGNFSKKYNVKTLVDIDSTFVELISPKILRVSGTIRNEINFSEKYELGFSFTSVTDDFDFSYDGMPLTLQKSKARLSFDGRRLLVQEFKSQVGSGSLLASGEVIVKFPFPSININYSLDNAKFNFIDKSNFYLNGNGLFLGEKIPYDLSGELTLENGDINLEFDELSKAGGFTIGGEKYLPKRVSINQLKLIDSNITLSTKGPLLFKNSIVNVSFKGDINVTDNIFNPKIGGKMISIPGLSRFFFKNNEFNISKGEVYFTDINGVLNPELDFLANSAIDDYTITMRVNGTSKDFKVGLSSDPFLAQNDILSLLAFGYTDEQTKNLSGEVRSEVSSVGVGTLLFESFKINEALKSEFGIKLNVGTELDDSQQSLLDGTSSGSGSSTVGRVRSATKVEVQKRLNDAMGLSVSSTVGGNIGQRQSMNLNYKINDTVSLEGVYENRTGDQIQGDIIDNSIGVDVKFRWSTK